MGAAAVGELVLAQGHRVAVKIDERRLISVVTATELTQTGRGPMDNGRWQPGASEWTTALDTTTAPHATTAVIQAEDHGSALVVDRVHLIWATLHDRDRRRSGAQRAQITTHHDLDGGRDAMGQQLAWARRQDHERHLHDSAMEQLQHRR